MKSILLILFLATVLPCGKKRAASKEHVAHFLTTGTWHIIADTYENAFGTTDRYLAAAINKN